MEVEDSSKTVKCQPDVCFSFRKDLLPDFGSLLVHVSIATSLAYKVKHVVKFLQNCILNMKW